MKGSRGFRVVFGIILLILFSLFLYKYNENCLHSDDFDSEHAFVYSEAVAKLKQEAAQQASMPAETVAPVAETAVPAEATASVEVPEIIETPTPVEQNPGLPAIDINSWEYVLVNAKNPLSADFAPPQIVNVSESQCPVDARIQPYLEAFLQGCRDAGLPVYLSSGYRSYAEQNSLFERKLGQGYTYESASTIVAPPGTSEHQTGLACDITDVYRESKSWENLEPTATFQWLNEHCAEYGFVLRYPKDKSGLAYDGSALQTVTGIIYEPWHFRYVGNEAAKYMKENNLCLEEFVALYQNPTV